MSPGWRILPGFATATLALLATSVDGSEGPVEYSLEMDGARRIAWRCSALPDRASTVALGSQAAGAGTEVMWNLTLRLPLIEDCASAVALDEDFNDDGMADLSVYGDTSLSTSTRAVVLVDVQTGGLVLSGNLPVNAIKTGPATYRSKESVGGSVFSTTYRFQGMRPLKSNSVEQVSDGSRCVSRGGEVSPPDGCLHGLVHATGTRPLCVEHTESGKLRRVDERKCEERR